MALTQVYELVRVTGQGASTSGSGRHLCRLRDRTYAVVYQYLNGASSEIRVSIGAGISHTWTEEVVASTPGSNLIDPCIAVDSRDNLHVCYEDDATGRIYYARRPHITGAWDTPIDISGVAGCASAVLAVGASDEVSFVWIEPIAGVNRVRLRQLSYEEAWGSIETVDTLGGNHNHPAIAYDVQGNLHIVSSALGYGTFPAAQQAIYNRRSASGTYGTQLICWEVNADLTYPSIAVDLANNVHVCYIYGPGGTINIAWQRKTPTGAAFDPYDGAKPGMAATSYFPSIAVSLDQAIHVAYTSNPGAENYGAYISNMHYTDSYWESGHCMEFNNAPWGVGHRYNLAMTADPSHCQLLWAMFPYINGKHTNTPATGTAMLFSDDTALSIYLHTFSGYGYYYGYIVPSPLEPLWDDTLTWETTTEVSDSPVLTTLPASAVDRTSAVLNGMVTDDQGSVCEVSFEYGPTIGYGRETEAQTGMESGDTFQVRLTGLMPGVTYHYRVKGRWAGQVFYGSDVILTTQTNEVILRTMAQFPLIF